MTAITRVEGEGQKGADLRARWPSDMAMTVPVLRLAGNCAILFVEVLHS